MGAWMREEEMKRTTRAAGLVAALLFSLAFVATAAGGDAGVTELVPDTAILLNQSGGGGGNGGNTSSTTSRTNIFAPSAYVDYKRLGGEPTVVVDRYPFTPGQFGNTTTVNQYRDIGYYSAPLGVGFPGYSYFWKSDDQGKTWRLPPHDPVFGRALFQGPGGGDSHQAVGEATHNVFFVDLPGPCETMNRSTDLGETFTTDLLGCGTSAGAIDDRQWVATDESYPGSPNVYVSFIQVFDITGTVPPFPTLALARSQHDGAPGTFATDSTCNTLSAVVDGTSFNPIPTTGAADSTETACPDPNDVNLYVAGPVIADKEGYSGRPTPSHRAYIPFVRSATFSGGAPWRLYVAISSNGGNTWHRVQVANRGEHNPANIFVQMTVDRGGNLYYTWSEETTPGGEQDVYYAYSTDGGETWSQPIPLTQENGDSAVFPWMAAGDPGQVDLVYYKSNTGLNSNFAFVDANGEPCSDQSAPCGGNANPPVWQTYFGQSQNALNTGSNFKSVQITDHPIHIGSVSTGGLEGESDRSLLDFLTVDIDHLGAANVAWADDNNSRSDTRNKFARQISGNSVYKNQTIGLQQSWPIRDHAVSDPAGDVRNADGLPTACPSMDVLSTATQRSGDLLTVSMTLGAPPSAATAIACAAGGATGGLWGAEFWASSTPASAFGGGPDANFYVAYRDNPGDVSAPTPGVEGGRVDALGATLTQDEFHREVPGVPATPGGTCFSLVPPTPCTIVMTVPLSSLGIKSGSGLYSITGGAFYYFATQEPVPATRVPLGFSNQADVTAALDDNGTGTTR
jgi:BNR/Asp-box repeat